MKPRNAIITGGGGLVGSEAARYFHGKGLRVVGIDNDMRSRFFGPEASTARVIDELRACLPDFHCEPIDIRNGEGVRRVFARFGADTDLVVHTAAQPSHDWAARDPRTDFGINANGTLNLLEAVRRYCPDAVFIFTSTNKVYGDTPNRLPVVELETRWDLPEDHPFFSHGVDESMSVDFSMHSLFGVSKLAADLLVQEYGRYFGMKTGVFRCGCITGPGHSAAELHGFLAYLMRCAVSRRTYRVFGYNGKQVRDNIHSADLVSAFDHFFHDPRPGEVYNMGGGRYSHCSLIEAVDLCAQIAGTRVMTEYVESNRPGDHVWWVSDTRKFQRHYPEWSLSRTVHDILREIFETNRSRWLM